MCWDLACAGGGNDGGCSVYGSEPDSAMYSFELRMFGAIRLQHFGSLMYAMVPLQTLRSQEDCPDSVSDICLFGQEASEDRVRGWSKKVPPEDVYKVACKAIDGTPIAGETLYTPPGYVMLPAVAGPFNLADCVGGCRCSTCTCAIGPL